jgi:uncharacterized protein YbaR (Trm112 family)/SAM-dependent methyltransferase
MQAFVSDLLCCPECGMHPLELTALETSELPRPEVETGFLFCPDCRRFYFIAEGIPRLLTEDFAELIDLSVPERFPDAFGARREQLDAFLSAVATGRARSAGSTWNVEDVAFWEDEVYGAEKGAAILQRAAAARRDAGNRTYPRERAIFGRLRSEIAGGVMLDLGCGLAQAIRTLCHPDEVGYDYIGADLSISALRTNRRTLRGDFVQCTAERVPFRGESVDAVVMLGTLHHLSGHEDALRNAVAAVRPGGWIALDEVVARHHVMRRVRELVGLADEVQSAHNESADPAAIERCLADTADTLVKTRLYSPLRAALANVLSASMETRPWLTEQILVLDALCLSTLGRVSPFFAGNEMLVLARKRGAGTAARPGATSVGSATSGG